MKIIEYILLLVLLLVFVKVVDLLFSVADYIYRVLSVCLNKPIEPYDVSYYVNLGFYIGLASLTVGIIVKMWTAIREKGEKR